MVPQGEADFYPILTHHAQRRMQQLGISRECVLACLMFGERTQKRHATFIHLRRCDIPEGFEQEFERFEDVALILGHDGSIITVYHVTRRGAWRRALWGRKH